MATHDEAGTGPRRISPEMLVRRIRSQVGLSLRSVIPPRGGEIGVGRVEDPSGRIFILSSVPGDPEGRRQHARSLAVLEQLWARGHPAPRYEEVIDLGDLLVVLQEEVVGVPLTFLSRALVDRLVQVMNERTAAMTERPEAGPLAVYLNGDGPSFAQHWPLRGESHRTRRLLEWVEAVGDHYGDALSGNDAVHFDYQAGNVLVRPDRPSEVSAIVDWDGASAGPIGFDLVTLAFVLGSELEREAGVDAHLEGMLRSVPEETLVPSLAHLTLRLLDWCIRFHPEYLGYWLARAERFSNDFV